MQTRIMLLPLLLVLSGACRDSTPLGLDPHGPLAPSSPLTSTASALLAATDFSEYPAGQQPSDWTKRWTATGTASWTVQRDSTGTFAGNSKLVLNVSAGQGATRALSWDQVGERADVRAQTRLRMAAVVDRLVGLTVLGGGVVGKEDGYAWVVENSSTFTGLRLWRVKGGQNQTALGSQAVSLAANTFYHLLLERKADTVRAKVWTDGAMEPSTWQVTAIDTLLKSGWAGFAAYSPGTVEFDFFRAYDPTVQGSLMPPMPPDSLPAHFYDDANWVENPPCRSLPIVRHLVAVWFKENATPEQRQAALDLVGGTVVGGVPISEQGLYLLWVDDNGTGAGVCQAVSALQALPYVELARPDYEVGPNYRKPKDSEEWKEWRLDPRSVENFAKPTWALEAIAAPLAWGCETGDPALPVAVVDFGFYVSNIPDLDANVDRSRSVGIDRVAPIEHGTAVAGILAARGNNTEGMTGLMWHASLRLYDYQVGAPRRNPLSKITDAMGLALAVGPKVVNLSAGIPEGMKPDSATVREWHQELRAVFGTTPPRWNVPMPLLVLSAGNRDTLAYWNGFPNIVEDYPDHVIVVGAATPSRSRWSTSNYGPLVQVFAPGEKVASFDKAGAITRYDHTSVATPLVSGLAGLLFSFDPVLTPRQVKQLILDGAARGKRSAGDLPIINAYESLKAAAEEHGRPLCGNRVWGADGKIWAQRGSGAPEDLRAISGTGAHHLQVLHGGKHITYASNTGGEELQWNPTTRRFVPGPPPPDFKRGGTYLSLMGYDHDMESFGWIDDAQVNNGQWYKTGSQAEALVKRGPPGGPFTPFSTIRVNNLPDALENICLERSSGTCWLTLLESRRWLVRLAYPQHERQQFSAMVSPIRVTPIDSTEWVPCSFNAQRECRQVQTLQRHLGTLVYTINQAGGDPVRRDSLPDNSLFWVGLSESDSTQVLSMGRWKITVWNDAARYYNTGSPYYDIEKEVESCAMYYGAQQPFVLGQSIPTQEACHWDSWRYPDYGGGGTIAPSRIQIPLSPQAAQSGPLSLPMPLLAPTRAGVTELR